LIAICIAISADSNNPALGAMTSSHQQHPPKVSLWQHPNHAPFRKSVHEALNVLFWKILKLADGDVARARQIRHDIELMYYSGKCSSGEIVDGEHVGDMTMEGDRIMPNTRLVPR